MYNLNDNKRWRILIIVIAILILGVIIPLITMIPRKTKVKNNVEKENNEEKSPQVLPYNETQVLPYNETPVIKEDETEEFDPYAKYKDIVWCENEDTIQTVVIYAEQDGLNLKNTINDEYNKWQTDITAKKVHFNGSKNEAIMLSNTGKVFRVTADKCTPIEALDKYNIIDMAYVTKNKKSEFYFLTDKGKLIDITAEPHDKPDFANTLTYGDTWKIYMDKDGYVYLKDEVELEYKPITTDAKLKLKIANIYVFDEYLVLESSSNKLFGCLKNDTVAKLTNKAKLKKVQKTVIDGDVYIIYICEDGTGAKSINPLGAFNVAKNKKIDINKIEEPYKNDKQLEKTKKLIEQIAEIARTNLLAAYDGVEMSGMEMLYTFSEAEETDFSVVLITKEKGVAYSGQYKLDAKDLKASNKSSAETITKHKIYSEGVYFMGKEEEFVGSTKRIVPSELEYYFDVTTEKTYYSSLILDKTGKEIGILFMEK